MLADNHSRMMNTKSTVLNRRPGAIGGTSSVSDQNPYYRSKGKTRVNTSNEFN